MNSNSNGFPPPPFFQNGSCPVGNTGMNPTPFNRPPPPFPPPHIRFPPPGHNGFNPCIGNNYVRPNGFQRPNLNSSGFNRFSSPPPPLRGPPPSTHDQPAPIHRPPPHTQGPYPPFCGPPPVRGPPPPIRGPSPVQGQAPSIRETPPTVRGPSSGLPRPVFTPDNIFSPPPSMTAGGQECFPFNTNHSRPQHSPVSDRGGRGGGHGRGRGGFANYKHPQSKKKKEKVDKRDLPENNAFFCDTCDRGFKTQEKYQEHVDGHMKCSYKDCPFIAAPKLVQLHIALQHRTGLAKQVWSMESEEDVKKWREERKRKFPTAANIAKKKEEEAERIARGEILQTKDFSVMGGGRGRGQGRNRGGRGKWRGQNRRGRGRGGRFHPNSEGSEVTENGRQKAEIPDSDEDDAPPTETAITHSHSLDEQQEEDFREKENTVEKELQQVESVLEVCSPNTTSLGLLSSYGYSSSDEEKEEQSEKNDTILQTTEALVADSVTESEPLFQPSPSKRPRLLPNPFLPPEAQSHSASGESCLSEIMSIEQPPDSTGTSTSNYQSKDRDGKSPHKSTDSSSLELIHENETSSGKTTDDGSDCKQKVLTSPRKLTEGSSGSPSKASTASAHDPEGKASGDIISISVKKSNKNNALEKAIEDGGVTVKEKEAKAESHSQRNKKDGTGRQQSKKQSAAKQIQPLKYTLLEKLLAPDIRRERNKILQCVHYIVKNKFFDPIMPSSSSEVP